MPLQVKTQKNVCQPFSRKECAAFGKAGRVRENPQRTGRALSVEVEHSGLSSLDTRYVPMELLDFASCKRLGMCGQP